MLNLHLDDDGIALMQTSLCILVLEVFLDLEPGLAVLNPNAALRTTIGVVDFISNHVSILSKSVTPTDTVYVTPIVCLSQALSEKFF